MKTKQGRRIYGVIGLGRFGNAITQELALAGCDVLAVDNTEKPVREIRKYTENAFVSSSVDADTLREIGFAKCDVAIVCVGEKLDTSLLATLNLLAIGVPRVIAKASTAEHGQLLQKIGAEVIYPERDMGIMLARKLESSSILETITLSNRVDITEVRVPQFLVNKTISHSALRSRYHLNVIAIRRGEQVLTAITPDEVLREDDILLLIGTNDDLHHFLADTKA